MPRYEPPRDSVERMIDLFQTALLQLAHLDHKLDRLMKGQHTMTDSIHNDITTLGTEEQSLETRVGAELDGLKAQIAGLSLSDADEASLHASIDRIKAFAQPDQSASSTDTTGTTGTDTTTGTAPTPDTGTPSTDTSAADGAPGTAAPTGEPPVV